MIRIILWYNASKRVGLVWCEDQGPLAYIGPEIQIPGDRQFLGCGDQITFLHEVCEKVRYVTQILRVEPGSPETSPRDFIEGYNKEMMAKRLRVVA